jgi:acid phosphatase type 7
MKSVVLEFGSVIMDIDGDTLTGIMLNKDGEKRDQFRIIKSGRVAPTRIANPRQLPPYTPPPKPAADTRD